MRKLKEHVHQRFANMHQKESRAGKSGEQACKSYGDGLPFHIFLISID
jgi:hypothetical protein